LEDVKKDIEYRDKNDSNREFALCQKLLMPIEIDTTDLTIEQVVNKIMEYGKGLCMLV